MNNDSEAATCVVGQQPQITAPVRLEGQTDSEVLFTWMKVHQFLWMLESPQDDELCRITGSSVYLELTFHLVKWKREPSNRADGHNALLAPKEEAARVAAFSRLGRLIKIHLFDSGGSTDG